LDCSRIKAGLPVPNQAYFYNPKHADGPNRFVRPEQVHLYQPDSRWKEIWRKDEPRKWAAVAIQDAGLSRLLPSRIVSKLDRPNPSVRVFQVLD
jgi:hypothetical protein